MRPLKLPWRSLQTRVTLFALLACVAGIWTLSWLASQALRDDMQEVLGEQQFSTVSLLAGELNHAVDERLTALNKVAAEVRPGMMGDASALQGLLEHRPVFQSLFNGGVLVVGMDGTVLADVPRSTGRIGLNVMRSDAVATALRQGKTSVGQPMMGRVVQAPVFGMAAPIRNAQGQVIGALTGITMLGQPNFLDAVVNNRYGKSGGFVLLMPSARLIITATDKSRIMTALPASGSNPTLDRFVAGFEGSAVYVNPLGTEVLGSAKSIPAAGWSLGLTLPTAEAFCAGAHGAAAHAVGHLAVHPDRRRRDQLADPLDAAPRIRADAHRHARPGQPERG